ncbi:MAG: sugar phosphate isomerase/epimerase family protein [Candidatus Ornithospirochaeta sp.]
MIVPGIVSATFKTRSVEEVVSISSRCGLKAIEWSENHHIAKGDLEKAEKVASLTKENGLETAGYGSYYRLGEGMDLRSSIETALALGTRNVRIWAGGKASSLLEKDERNALLCELEKAVEMAGEYGVVLNTEWHKNTLTDENQSGFDMLSSIPGLRTLWQPTQALSFSERAEGLEMILPRLSYFHVYYWDESGRRPLEEGIEHWRKYFSLVDEEKKYYALLEFVMGDSVEQFEKDAATLERLLQKGV